MDSCKIEELGVICEFPKSFQVKLGNQWSVAKKLSVPRTFSFLALSQLFEEFYGIGMTALSCIEAIPGLGLAGIEWKRHLGDKVNVTINSSDAESKEVIAKNSLSNSVDAKNGGIITHEDANALLHSQTKLNFIYLEAYGNCVRYLDSAFHVICHRGIICIVSTDLSTLYNKSPQRVQRIYHGHTMKNEYVKELSVRLILANVARAASRWDRGISVLLSYVDENSVTILVRVLKGATHADKSLGMIQKTAHCRVCHYQCLINEKLHYAPQPGITDCMCKENGLASEDMLPPIVMLGPVYTGPIFDALFLIQARNCLVNFDRKHILIGVLQNMITESMCFKSDNVEAEFIKILGKVSKEDSEKDTQEPQPKKCKTEEESNISNFLEKHSSDNCPVFFYLPQAHTKKGLNPPKIQHVIQKLRSEGFRACKTLFDPRGVKTSALPKQFCKIVNDTATETQPHPSSVM